jgi:hypothetical protein
MSQSVQTTVSGQCILLAAWMRSEALQCFHSLLISKPISEIDSKIGSVAIKHIMVHEAKILHE